LRGLAEEHRRRCAPDRLHLPSLHLGLPQARSQAEPGPAHSGTSPQAHPWAEPGPVQSSTGAQARPEANPGPVHSGTGPHNLLRCRLRLPVDKVLRRPQDEVL